MKQLLLFILLFQFDSYILATRHEYKLSSYDHECPDWSDDDVFTPYMLYENRSRATEKTEFENFTQKYDPIVSIAIINIFSDQCELRAKYKALLQKLDDAPSEKLCETLNMYLQELCIIKACSGKKNALAYLEEEANSLLRVTYRNGNFQKAKSIREYASEKYWDELDEMATEGPSGCIIS